MNEVATYRGPTLPGEGDHFTVEVYADRAAWLAARPGIGGSDAVSLWQPEIAEEGGKTFGTPFQVYAQKRRLLPQLDDAPEPDYLRIGRRMEQVIADEYAEAAKLQLVYPGLYTILRNLAQPGLAVSLDRVIVDAVPGVLECKNRSVGAHRDWADGLPLAVQVQIAHALLVTGWTWGVGAAIIGGNRFVAHRYDRDDDFLHVHRRRCMEMLARIDAADPPPVSGHAADLDALARIYAHDDGEQIVASAQIVDMVELWEDMRADQKRKAAIEEHAEAYLRSLLGETQAALLPDGRVFRLAVEIRKPRLCECGRQVQKGWQARVPRIVKGRLHEQPRLPKDGP